jgi:hypothetical protein
MYYILKKYSELKPVINEFLRGVNNIGHATIEDKFELLLTAKELNLTGNAIDDNLTEIARVSVEEMNLINSLIRHVVIVKYDILESERKDFIKYWLYDEFYKAQDIVTVSIIFQMLVEDYELLLPEWKLKLLKKIEELGKQIKSVVAKSWFPFYFEKFNKTEQADKIVKEILLEREKNGSWNGNFEKTLKVAYALACSNNIPKIELQKTIDFINRRISLGTSLNAKNCSLILKLYYKLNFIGDDVVHYLREALQKSVTSEKFTSSSTKKKVFISYSHSDTHWLERVLIHLKPLERQGLLEIWSDTRLVAGNKWKTEIKNALNEAAVAVLLISADFLASDFISTEELPVLLNSAKLNGITIVPIIIGHSLFLHQPLINQFQSINSPDKPIEDLQKGEQEKIFADLAVAINRHIN